MRRRATALPPRSPRPQRWLARKGGRRPSRPAAPWSRGATTFRDHLSSLCVFCALCGLVAAARAGEYARPEAAYAPGWVPADLADARERTIGAEKELYVNVSGVEVSVPSEFRCGVGHREELPLLIAKRGTTLKHIVITGAGPRGVALDPSDVTMRTNRQAGRVTPAVQTLLLHDTYIMLTVAVGKETARMPVRLVPEPTRPVFGVLMPDAADEAWEPGQQRRARQAAADVPAQFLSVGWGSTPAGSTFLSGLLEAAPYRFPMLLPVGDWVGSAPRGLRAAVERWRDDVHVWSAGDLAHLVGDREDVGQAGRAVLRAAESLATAVKELDPMAEVVSPTFPRSAADGASFDGKLLRWLLANGIGEHVGAVSFDIGAASVASASEPERWRELDRSTDIAPLSALVRESSVELGIWCGGYGVAGSGDPVLDALAAVRRQVALAFQGVRGAAYSPLALPGLRSANAGEAVPLCDASGDGQSLIGAAVGEALTELAGATPVYVADDSPPCSTKLGAEITFLPFVRGNEGIVWVWSNSARGQTLRLVFRQEPLGKRELAFRPKGRFIERQVDLTFVATRRPRDRAHVLDFTLAPLEIKAFSFPIVPALPAWIATVNVR